MDEGLFLLLLGAVTLALTVTAATAVLRRAAHAPFALIAAGFLAALFFSLLTDWPPAAAAIGLLLAFTGFATIEEPTELAESTLTRRRR
jgi:hypothetical protein